MCSFSTFPHPQRAGLCKLNQRFRRLESYSVRTTCFSQQSRSTELNGSRLMQSAEKAYEWRHRMIWLTAFQKVPFCAWPIQNFTLETWRNWKTADNEKAHLAKVVTHTMAALPQTPMVCVSCQRCSSLNGFSVRWAMKESWAQRAREEARELVPNVTKTRLELSQITKIFRNRMQISQHKACIVTNSRVFDNLDKIRSILHSALRCFTLHHGKKKM